MSFLSSWLLREMASSDEEERKRKEAEGRAAYSKAVLGGRQDYYDFSNPDKPELVRTSLYKEPDANMWRYNPQLAQTITLKNAEYAAAPIEQKQRMQFEAQAAQQGSDTHKALWKANVYEPNKQNFAKLGISEDQAYASFGDKKAITLDDINRERQAKTFGEKEGPERTAFADVEGLGLRRNQIAAEETVLPSSTERRMTENVLGTTQNQAQQIRAEEALKALQNNRQIIADTARNSIYGEAWKEAHPSSQPTDTFISTIGPDGTVYVDRGVAPTQKEMEMEQLYKQFPQLAPKLDKIQQSAIGAGFGKSRTIPVMGRPSAALTIQPPRSNAPVVVSQQPVQSTKSVFESVPSTYKILSPAEQQVQMDVARQSLSTLLNNNQYTLHPGNVDASVLREAEAIRRKKELEQSLPQFFFYQR